jgi:redox-sensitive bicupin YhaK (pirin superfamily)
MIDLRRKETLGRSEFPNFRALHHVRVGSPHDNLEHGPIGNLVVWNDDEIDAGTGVPLHRHANVEIITYVREGTIEHHDSLGNGGSMQAGDVQVMSAGTGLAHAEHSAVDTKIFQIWITPRLEGGAPRWGTKAFPKTDSEGEFVVIASGFSEDLDALPIRADARILGATLNAGQVVKYDIGAHRSGYLVPAIGRIRVNGVALDARDGAAIRGETSISIEALEYAEVVLADLTGQQALDGAL